MRTMIALALVMIGAGRAAAQPGMTEPVPPGSVAPSYAPMPYAYQPQVWLNEDERDLLADGEISGGRYLGGGMAAVFFGFGVGHAVQGRWLDQGWIFTFGEPAAFGVMMAGILSSLGGVDCTHDCHGNRHGDRLAFGGAVALVGLRVWEIVDAFVAPPHHNARVRALRMRLGQPGYTRLAPYVAPAQAGDGGVAGLALRF